MYTVYTIIVTSEFINKFLSLSSIVALMTTTLLEYARALIERDCVYEPMYKLLYKLYIYNTI